MRCKAKAKQRQAQCKLSAVPGMEVCRFHGGRTPIGPASATYKSGKYSRFLPTRRFAAYKAAGLNPELLSLCQDLALLDARIIDVLKRVDTGEAGVVWRDAQAAMAAFNRAKARQDMDGMTLALANVERSITQGTADYAAWREVGKLIDQRRKLVESEQRQLTLAHEMISREQAMALLGQVVDIIRRRIPDRDVLNAIALDMQALGHRGNGHAAAADPHG